MKGNICSTKTLLEAPIPPMLIDSFIPRRGVVGISSDPGAGKTFFAMEMIKRVVCKELFLERFKTRRASCLFIGQDCSELEYARQARKTFQDAPQTSEFERSGGWGMMEDEVEVIDPFNHVKWLLHDGVNLANPGDVAQLVSIANNIPALEFEPGVPIDAERTENGWENIYGDPNGVGLIVFDTWSKCHRASENSNDEMNRAFDGLRMLSEATNAAVLLLHHHSYGNEFNSGSRWRGASSQLGALDAHIELKKGKGDEIYVNFRKYRGVRPEDFSMTMKTTETTCDFAFVGHKGSPEAEVARAPGDVMASLDYFLTTIKTGERFKVKQFRDFLCTDPEWANLPLSTLYSRVSGALELAEPDGKNLVKQSGYGIWEKV